MSLCLYECLRAVGLQSHYARFNSVGIHRAAHLSSLTMEDYPILGIRSMEDRTRLFHLVQMVKTLDLEYEDEDDGDDDFDADGGDEGYTVANSFTHNGCRDPGEDVYDYEDDQGASVSKLHASSFSKPSSVRRRLDFSCDPIDHHMKQFSHQGGNVHIYASHNINNVPCQGKESSISAQLNTGNAVVCGCKGKNNHRPDVHRHQSDHHSGENAEPNIIKGNSKNNSHTRLSPKYGSFQSPKPRPAQVASNRVINKPVEHKDRKEKLHTDSRSNGVIAHTAQPTPVYESKRTAGYNYGLPLTSPQSPYKK
ncbi:uncharacterized protein LOC131974424 [Centropristis striata]|uniref:uncharacterized protein LOC131974424 n=1 Tax=Centropristis striata TaxID=184440 RepID=UPI0027DECA66|nr:uncharacterized protein LOC131974424 [Centropristis striata]